MNFDIKDKISMISSIDLGLIGAGLTLLAIYPAIGILLGEKLAQSDSTYYLQYNRQRKNIQRSLGYGILSAWISLMIVVISAFSSVYVQSLFYISLIVTTISLLFIGHSAWLIFKNTIDNS